MIETLRALLAREYKTSESFTPALSKNQSSLSYSDYLSWARSIFRLCSDGTEDTSIVSWGTWAEIPLPLMLCLQRSLIVNVYPLAESDFVRFYGVTIPQFVTLCKRRLVIPNLYEDRALQRDPASTGYLRHPELAPIFNEDTGCRILGIRRDRLLEAIGMQRGIQKSVEREFREILSRPIKEIPLDQLNARLAGAPNFNHEGVLDKLANNLKYIDILGDQDDVGRLYSLVRTFGARMAFEEPSIFDLLEWARGRKTALASPLTAAFGGTYNNQSSEQQLADRFKEIESPRTVLGHTLDNEYKALLEFHAWLLDMKRQREPRLPEGPVALPLKDKEFASFLSFLEEMRETLENIDDVFRQFTFINKQAGGAYDLSKWQNYWSLFDKLRRQGESDPSVFALVHGLVRLGFLGWGAANMAAEVLRHYHHLRLGEASRREFIIGAAVLLGIDKIGPAAISMSDAVYSEAKNLFTTEEMMVARRTIIRHVSKFTGM